MDKEEKRKRLEKYLPKRVLDVVDKAIIENTIATQYLLKVKSYKKVFMPEIQSNVELYTMADMIRMFRYGLHHNDEEQPQEEQRVPLFKSGDILKAKDDPNHTLQIKGYNGDRYKVKDQGIKGFEFYSMDYVEEKFEKA